MFILLVKVFSYGIQIALAFGNTVAVFVGFVGWSLKPFHQKVYRINLSLMLIELISYSFDFIILKPWFSSEVFYQLSQHLSTCGFNLKGFHQIHRLAPILSINNFFNLFQQFLFQCSCFLSQLHRFEFVGFVILLLLSLSRFGLCICFIWVVIFVGRRQRLVFHNWLQL